MDPAAGVEIHGTSVPVQKRVLPDAGESEDPAAKRPCTGQGAGDELEFVPTRPSTAESPNPAKRVTHVPCKEPPSDPKTLQEAVRGQIEYYFCDDNMKYDRFFQKKIRENPEGWLKVDNVLSCRNIRSLGITSADCIIESLQTSHLETKKDENGDAWIRRTTPLPTLEGDRPPRQPKKQQKLVDIKTLHDAGCFGKASGCPEEASWEAVKTAVAQKLPAGASIRHVSPLDQDGSCFLYFLTFEGDREFFANDLHIDVCGADVAVSLITDPAEGTKAVKSLPSVISQWRERRQKREGGKRNNGKQAAVRISLGGTEFGSVGHLRNCVKELLKKTSKGTVLNKEETAFKVISEVLKYHPNADTKARDVADIKVDEIEKNGETSKCFFVVRSDGEVDDFSAVKCLMQLERNPPVKEHTAKNAKAEEKREELTTSVVGDETVKAEAIEAADKEGGDKSAIEAVDKEGGDKSAIEAVDKEGGDKSAIKSEADSR